VSSPSPSAASLRRWPAIALIVLAGGCSGSSDTQSNDIEISAAGTEFLADATATASPGSTTPTTQAPTTSLGGVPDNSGQSLPSIATTTTTITTTTTTVPTAAVRWEVAETPGGWAEAAGLTGGHGREEYVITSANDAGPGTYRDALSVGGRHIRFDPAMNGTTIDLQSPVIVEGSDITLDGSDVDVTVSGSATRFSGTNVIVAGMRYSGMDATDNEDALTFLEPSGPQLFGLYGNVFERGTDGLVDVIWNRNHRVDGTACGNLFREHDKGMLVDSGRDGREGGTYHITLCRNHWLDVFQRMPLARRARVHVYNSVLERYGKPNGDGAGAKAGSRDAEILLESNIAIPRSIGETSWDGGEVTAPRGEYAGPGLGTDGDIRIVDTLEVSVDGVDAYGVEDAADQVFQPDYAYDAVPASPELAAVIMATAGQCLPTPADQVVPCTPLVIARRGDELRLTVDRELDELVVMLGDEVLEARPDGPAQWVVRLDGPTGQIDVVQASAGGVRVEQNQILVALVE
jgi:pectate lyase